MGLLLVTKNCVKALPTRLDTTRVVGYYHLLSFRVIMLSEWKSR